jgi:hypothetical protein
MDGDLWRNFVIRNIWGLVIQHGMVNMWSFWCFMMCQGGYILPL